MDSSQSLPLLDHLYLFQVIFVYSKLLCTPSTISSCLSLQDRQVSSLPDSVFSHNLNFPHKHSPTLFHHTPKRHFRTFYRVSFGRFFFETLKRELHDAICSIAFCASLIKVWSTFLVASDWMLPSFPFCYHCRALIRLEKLNLALAQLYLQAIEVRLR
jgi:hypothetical protein